MDATGAQAVRTAQHSTGADEIIDRGAEAEGPSPAFDLNLHILIKKQASLKMIAYC
jgi:hypothetical protein